MSGPDPSFRGAMLRAHLRFAVPMKMIGYAEAGGPSDAERAAVTAYGETLAEHGDDLIFGGGDYSSTVLVAELTRAIAVLAFCPGGITIFAMHFQSSPPVYGRAVA